jgi:hypothetical protein
VIGACKGYQKSNEDFWKADERIEQYLDKSGAVPPAMICGAFGVIKQDASGFKIDAGNPLYHLFNCCVTYTDAAKPLNQFALPFDLFRQRHRIPVIPATTLVHFLAIDGPTFKDA